MFENLSRVISGGKNIAVGVAGLLMTVAFITFMLAIINFIYKRAKGESNGLEQARNMLFGSVIGLFFMVAVWGITTFVAINLGIGVGGCISKPSPIPGQAVQEDCGRSSGGSGTGGTGTGGSSNTNSPIDQNEIDRNGDGTSIINGFF